MAKEYYDQKIGPNTDWGGDSSTGGLQVKGNRVQEYIKGEIADLHAADKKAPSVFGGFVNNVSLKNTDAGSDYVKVVYDTTRHMFFAVTMEDEVEKYHRQYDDFSTYNEGNFPNAYPYSGKAYVYGSDIYQWDGEELTCSIISQEDFDAIFQTVELSPSPSPEPEQESENEQESEP